MKCNLELIVLQKNRNLNKKYAKSEQNLAKCSVFTQEFKPRQLLEKNEIHKNLINFKLYAGRASK